jgi:hypothetical protein
MPEYLSPGVYVEEIDTGNKPIEGVSTSTAGMLGVTERGPVNVPILITSYGEYRRWFGERLPLSDFSNAAGPHCFLPHALLQRCWASLLPAPRGGRLFPE